MSIGIYYIERKKVNWTVDFEFELTIYMNKILKGNKSYVSQKKNPIFNNIWYKDNCRVPIVQMSDEILKKRDDTAEK